MGLKVGVAWLRKASGAGALAFLEVKKVCRQAGHRMQ